MSYRISLTDFVDIVSKSGTPKYTKTKDVLTREQYHPNFDFYKPLRENIIEFHILKQPPKHFQKVLAEVSGTKKYTKYEDLVKKHLSWCGKKKISFFKPASNVYTFQDIDITINPELGLIINNQGHLVKLYFKAGTLAKNKADIINQLMRISLSTTVPKNTLMSVLDLGSKKLITSTGLVAGLTNVLNAEIAYISQIAKTL